MGSIHCTRIPFILIATSQSHPSPLSDLYSADPQVDPKTHTGTKAVVLFLCHNSHDPPMLINPCSMFRSFFVMIMSYHIFVLQSWWFCLLSAPLRFHCLHTLYCYLFLAIGPCTNPALNSLVYIIRIGYTNHFFSSNIIRFSSPLLPCRLVDLRRGLLTDKNLQPSSLAPFPLKIFQTALLHQWTDQAHFRHMLNTLRSATRFRI